MSSNKRTAVSICIVIFAVTFPMTLNGAGATTIMSRRDDVTKPTMSVADHVTRSTIAVTESETRSTIPVTEPLTAVTGPVTGSTMAVTEPVTRSTIAVTESETRSTIPVTEPLTAVTGPVTGSTLAVTEPVTRSTMAVTGHVIRSTIAVTEPLTAVTGPVTGSTMAVTEPVTRSTMAVTEPATAVTGPITGSTMAVTEPVTRSTMAVTGPVTRSTMKVTQHVTRSSMSVDLTESTTSFISDVPDTIYIVSLREVSDTTSTVSSKDTSNRTSTVSTTDAPDRTFAVSHTVAPDRTSILSLSNGPDGSSIVSSTDPPHRKPTMSPIDPPDRTSSVSLIDAPDRTSTMSPTDAPDRASNASLKDAPDSTSTMSSTYAPDKPSTISPSDASDKTSTVSPTDVPETKFIEMWVKALTISTQTTALGENPLDRLLSIQVHHGNHGNHGNACPSGQVFYDGSCHVIWQNTTPPPLPSTQEHMSAPHTAGTSIQPRSTTTPKVHPPPPTGPHVQSVKKSTDIQPPSRVLVNSPSTTRDSMLSPSTPTTDNDVVSINEYTPTPSPTTHNYTGGHSKHHSTTGMSDHEALSHEPPAVTSPGRVLKTADTQSTTSRLHCNHIILDNSTFTIFPNGSVVLKGGKVINESDFVLTPTGQLKVCVTALGSQGSNTNEKFRIDRNRPTVVLTNICLVSSQVFLFLTFILHCFFPSLRNLPGVILMFLSASLFLAQTTFFVSDEAHNHTTCIAIGVVIHFFWLASFCWLNISSFHSFRVFKDVFASRRFEANRKRIILKYCIFGYGTPAVVIVATIIANYLESGSESLGYADGSNFCFVSNGTNSIVGMLVPAGVTIMVSCTLFILTIVYLWRASANRRNVGNGGKWNILMYIKLSTITGFSWVFGFLHMVDRSSKVFTYLFIFLTGAQGVFIFMAFMANKRTFLLVKHACRKQNKDCTNIHQNRLTLTQNAISHLKWGTQIRYKE